MDKIRSHFNRYIFGLYVAVFAPTSTAVAASALDAIDSLQPGYWYEIPNSKLISAAPSPVPSGVVGVPAVMDAWSGGVYDSVSDRLIVWGGGHADYAGNEVYAFDLSTSTWSMLIQPSSSVQDNVLYYSDGKPSSRHTYNNLVFAPNVNAMISTETGGSYGPVGNFGPNVDAFSFSTNTWSRKADNPGGGYKIGASSAYDSSTGTVWSVPSGQGQISQYNPVSDVWKAYANSNLEIYATAAIDPNRHILVAVGGYGSNRQIYVWDLDNPNNAPIVPATSGDRTLETEGAPGFVYDPVSDKFVGWRGGADFYILDPDTWVWSKVTPASGNTVVPTAANSQGTYGRFRYIPSKNAFIVVNSVDENVYVYKLTAGAGAAIPSLTISAEPNPVISGQSTYIVWSSTADTCTASDAWSGTKTASGSEVQGPITSDAVFVLECSVSGGATVATSVDVTVTAPPPSDPAPPSDPTPPPPADTVPGSSPTTPTGGSTGSNSSSGSGGAGSVEVFSLLMLLLMLAQRNVAARGCRQR